MLVDVPVGGPCPQCGGGRRDATVYGSVVMAASAVLTATASVGYHPGRPWQQKWRDTQSDLRQLEAVYAGPGVNNETMRRYVEAFFKDCQELADWLTHGGGSSNAMDFVHEDADLRLCDGMAQTTKHHTRVRGKDPVTAQVAWIHGGHHPRAELEWSTPAGEGGKVDALDLARRCIAAWERYFALHSLDAAG
ncbi:hypothetical protein [Cryptosporangium phraense]|uniref:Uncharacterized protein n=1 Tax=Cryptosporangium phraense TaxID=2593070 RepID=A0A545AW89_9ACTN|nr:hypothetical protein [Cryptosporangium phraense]TQS45588.1 hypothetical protein FL583_07610 [Cryptosporangium phraense]